jgi:predicted PurR-regulated permease PerM
MPERGTWSSRQNLVTVALGGITAVLLGLCVALTIPFFPALTWAAALAIVIRPVYDRLPLPARYPSLKAGIGMILVGLLVIGPAVLLGVYLVNKVGESIQVLQTEASSGRWQSLLDQYPAWSNIFHWIKDQVDLPRQLQNAAGALGKVLPAVLGSSLWMGAELLITLFLLFYFFRDERPILEWLRKVLPVTDRETLVLFRRVKDSVYATIMGMMVIALLQGALGGLMMWWVGLPAPILLAVIMAVFSLIPTLGAPVVWVPAVLFLLVQGSWGKAFLLVAWGATAIGLIDNLLYPILVGRRLALHAVPSFFALLGGVILFGTAGIVLGPLLLTITWTLMEIWRRRTEEGRAASDAIRSEAS